MSNVMKRLIFTYLFIQVLVVGYCQRTLEFNRLFNDPSVSNKWALTLAFNGYGYQTSPKEQPVFGSISITSHFFIDENTEFRLGSGYGRNVQSLNDKNASLLKLVTPKNYENYAGFLGFSRQFSLSSQRGLFLTGKFGIRVNTKLWML